ncbi:MAG TPA: DUF3626 domain-containing protein [Spirochaetia bacterium]|nr:DUF3626 domain-containing protein [Spirochaetia bacterium]
MNGLTAAQSDAIAFVSQYAEHRRAAAERTIDEILRMSNIHRAQFDRTVELLKANARVALHFHPDRPDSSFKRVVEAMLDQGIYRNQFETHISSGSLSAFPGGERDGWERAVFGGAYHRLGVKDGERPKYGALDLTLQPDGPAPRFGSCYVLLSPEASKRCTFTYLDSHDDPAEKGTLEKFDDILAALLKDLFLGDMAIGARDITVREFIDQLAGKIGKPFGDPAGGKPSRNLNRYIETQVHGEVSLADDVDILVADPSFADSATGDIMRALCARYSIALYWHMGFTLEPAEVPQDFRGPTMPSLAHRVACEGWVDASAIGEAAMGLKMNPAAWSDRGSYGEVLQELKLLWHVLVRYGRSFYPARPQDRRG